MKRQLLNIFVILVVLVITGLIRIPIEQELTEELLEKKLIPQRVTMETRLALKQKGFTAGLGSCRPTFAAMISIAASNSHSDQEWDQLEKQFDDILMLDPRNPYYWDIASWHMISNAAGSSRSNEELPYLTRIQLFHEYIDKGEAIIKRGKEENPDNWKMHELAPKHYGSRFRRPDYLKAAEQYLEVSRMPGVPEDHRVFFERSRLYCLNKLPEKHQESYDLALELLKKDQRNHVPSLLTSVWVGQNHPLNIVKNKFTLTQIFDSRQRAYHILKIQWQFKNKLEDRYGIEHALRILENDMGIPKVKRIFPHQPLFMKHNSQEDY